MIIARRFLRVLAMSAVLSAATLAMAQTASLTVGSGNVATADPLVPRPPTKPCVVTLYTNETFAFDFSLHHYTFTPPADCPGPWEKVVFSADFSQNAGRQFDRTAVVWLGGAVIYFGTTQEPSATVAPSWHVERDLTDYSALLTGRQDGYISLGNVVDSTYTGIYHTSAKLYFYPGGRGNQGERPDQVLALRANSTASLGSGTDQLAATLSLPPNIERAFLDVYMQSQSGEEFWYFDVPDNAVANTLGDTFASPFKEGLVTIDGQPAGIAPIYPWIYTGGADPILWRPIPGVQTLAFEPYRVDLTPFVGVLSNGAPHTVAVSVFNTTDHFATAASLLLYLDRGASRVSGGVTTNTLQATPVVTTSDEVAVAADGSFTGPLAVTSKRQFTISGTANTSHGQVTTRIDSSIAYSSVQQLSYVAATGTNTQDVVQTTSIDRTTTVNSGHGTATLHEQRSYPLKFNYDVLVRNDGSFDLDTFVDQEYQQRVDIGARGAAVKTAHRDNHRITSVTRHYDAGGNLLSAPAASSQTYTYGDPFGACYSRVITAQNRLLTSVTDGAGCPGSSNHLDWHDQFADFASRNFRATVKLLP